jgi:hypothetical protein
MPSPWNKDIPIEPPKAPRHTPEQIAEAEKLLQALVKSSIDHLELFNEVQTLLRANDLQFWAALAFAKGAARGAAVRTGTQATTDEHLWKLLEDLGYKSITEG